MAQKPRRTNGLNADQQRRLAELRERKAHGPAGNRAPSGRAPGHTRLPGHRAR
jgi:hypothetical protein